MNNPIQPVDATTHTHVNYRFGPFLKVLQKNTEAAIAAQRTGKGVLTRLGYAANFNGAFVYEAYLASFPNEVARQEHTCSCCKQFFSTFGNLLILHEDGNSSTALFQDSDEIPAEYRAFTKSVTDMMAGAQVERLFLNSNRYDVDKSGLVKPLGETGVVIGEAQRGGFEHFSYRLQYLLLAHRTTRTVWDLKEDARLLGEALHQWSEGTLNTATAQFSHDAQLSKTVHASHLTNFMHIRATAKALKDARQRRNYLLMQATVEPLGTVRVGTTVLGEYLNQLNSGSDIDFAKKRYMMQVDPVNYLRPTAAPSSQTIEQAEKLFAELDLGRSLAMRAARREEVLQYALWSPTVADAPPSKGLFGSVKAKDAPTNPVNAGAPIDGGRMSFLSFVTKVLPTAQQMWVDLTPSPTKRLFSAATMTDPTGTPILAWDRVDNRNPVTFYTYANPTGPQNWGLSYGWEEVLGLVGNPPSWTDSAKADLNLYFLVLAHGYDKNHTAGLPLFPATLRPELHGVRSVIEAYAREHAMTDVEQGFVGMGFPTDQQQVKLKVLTRDGTIVVYTIVTFE